ncbi:hypothetical protein AVEN_73291-1 [Araneus ventricosus]|uniref:RNase H type-1 domain-containing protein n=1 Tax=Araneus ventricosus TaxID=182803 RepID=A0A4Y2KJ70_ARAVE|nr:hypothetical protein AVEN_73291-1 [Araneus ventricosus]
MTERVELLLDHFFPFRINTVKETFVPSLEDIDDIKEIEVQHVIQNLRKVVIERALLYGAGVWGGLFTVEEIERLQTDQRVFLLKFTGAYRTTSKQALNVLTGIPPLHLTARAEFFKFQTWVCRWEVHDKFLCLGGLDCFVKLSEILLETRVLNIESQVQGSRFEVYTDGSKSDSEAGFAVCILEHGEPYEIFKFKLGVNNTVFQAELAAIDSLGFGKKIKINIIMDSQLSIEALRSSSSRSEVVIGAKENFSLAGRQIGLAWVKAHAGNPGNELADHHAKLATIQGVEMHLPTPYSCLKYRISKNLIREWGDSGMALSLNQDMESEVLLPASTKNF